jgi:hypothetical protein
LLEDLPAGDFLVEIQDAAEEMILATGGVVVPPPNEFTRAAPDRARLDAAARIASDFAARAADSPTPLRTRELWPLCAALGLVCFLLMILARRLPTTTKPRLTPTLHSVALLFVMLVFCGESIAQDAGDDGKVPDAEEIARLATGAAGASAPMVSQDLIASNVGGLPVLRCTIHFKELMIEAHLMFDLSLVVPFQIHKSSLGGLGLNPAVAPTQRVDIDFGNGIKLTQIPIETERYPLLEVHTKLHASALNEVPVVGFIGPAAFNSNVIELDMAKELLRMMGIATDEARALEMPYELKTCGIVVKGTGPAGNPVQAVLSTRIHDSALAPSLAQVGAGQGHETQHAQDRRGGLGRARGDPFRTDGRNVAAGGERRHRRRCLERIPS